MAERFIRAGSVKVTDKSSDAVAYLWTSANGKPGAAVYYGKQSKPISNYYYRDEKSRAFTIAGLFDARRARLKAKADDRAKDKAFVHSYKVGDIFERVWGYDQTNVNYWEVTKVKGKFVWVREIAQEEIDTGGMTGKTTPLPGKFQANEPEKKCLAQDGRIKINHYAWAYYAKPKMIAGVPTYGTHYTSSYA